MDIRLCEETSWQVVYDVLTEMNIFGEDMRATSFRKPVRGQDRGPSRHNARRQELDKALGTVTRSFGNTTTEDSNP
ncbi:unnamed protein product [Strongylus vulgaris]|uniref:Uncharacterized protein n=1 Tax=Strongylus vulgaris TaxID=40348 RepID=A0A3P7IAV6_STRVU|nr:unnamed protein product [Strongylus vulgaris]